MMTSKKKYSGKRWTGTAVVVIAVAVLVCGCKQEPDPGTSTPVEPVPEVFVKVTGATISGSVADSEVFITGRTVAIQDFWMSDHEVTQGEYAKYMTPAQEYDKGKGVNHPAYYVSWYDAIVYCNKRSLAEDFEPCYSIGGSTDPDNWGSVPSSSSSTWDSAECDFTKNGYRLPTEAEWEYAARGGNGLTGTQTKYAGSDSNLSDVAWYGGNSGSKTHEVKGKKANGLGLYDMSGNVREWCWGAVSGSYRVHRGGAWDYYANFCTVSHRGINTPYNRRNNYGLRVVRSAAVPTQN